MTFSDLKGTLELFIKKLYGEETRVRFRPHHFPYTEPSAEMDMSCFKCGGKGCSMCKGEGWIEILGCGMVHPKVLEMSGIDPNEYSGYASASVWSVWLWAVSRSTISVCSMRRRSIPAPVLNLHP